MKQNNYGFQVPVIKDSDFFLGEGNLPRNVLQETGNWKDSLPEAEKQLRDTIDSINCVAFATTEQIEAYERKAFGERNNYSDRFVALISGTTPQGNDPAKVYNAIREFGLVPEEMCPWSPDIQSIEEYLSWKGVDKDACIAEGKKWKERKDFMHNWVFKATAPLDEKINNMIVALRYSPLCFDVSAWQTNSEGKYIRFGMSGHWTMGYNIGDFIDVRDSYPPHEKQLVKDFNFFYCKRISITKKTPLTYPQKKSIWQIIISFLWKEPEEIKRLEPDLNPDFVSPKTRPVVEEPPKLKWKFPSDARHSVRVLCDELGLTVAEKNLICQVIQCESGFRTDAKNENKDKNGKILSTDWGICQMNDYWYIGKNRPIATIREAIENPEKCVRIMIKRYKEGGLRDWVCYLKGMYKNYKP